jgi:hypothetical protein
VTTVNIVKNDILDLLLELENFHMFQKIEPYTPPARFCAEVNRVVTNIRQKEM